MLEVLQGLIQQHGQDAVVNNPAVPDQHNEGVMQDVMSSIMGGLSNQTSGGGLGSLMGMLGGGGSGGATQAIEQMAISSLMSKFGLSNSAAGSVVAGMVPQVLSGLMNHANNVGGGTAGGIESVLGGLLSGGGQQQQAGGGGLGGLLGGLFGK